MPKSTNCLAGLPTMSCCSMSCCCRCLCVAKLASLSGWSSKPSTVSASAPALRTVSTDCAPYFSDSAIVQVYRNRRKVLAVRQTAPTPPS